MPAATETPLSETEWVEEIDMRRRLGQLPRETEDFGDTAPILPAGEHPVSLPTHFGMGPNHPLAHEQ